MTLYNTKRKSGQYEMFCVYQNKYYKNGKK